MKIKGVILAGGHGSRLYPMTKIFNKSLLPVYDKPMIMYPMETLKQLGCEEIMIVSGREHSGQIMTQLGSGHEFDVDLERSFMIGDRWRDIEAGIAAGCRTIFIDYGYNEKSPRVYNFRVLSTHEAISTILNEETYEKD